MSNLTNVEKKEAVEKKNFWKVFWRQARNWTSIVMIFVMIFLLIYTKVQSDNIEIQYQKIEASLGQLSYYLSASLKIEPDQIPEKILGDKLFPLFKWVKWAEYSEAEDATPINEWHKSVCLDNLESYLKTCQCIWTSVESIDVCLSPYATADRSRIKEDYERIIQLSGNANREVIENRNYTGLTFIVKYKSIAGRFGFLFIIDNAGPIG